MKSTAETRMQARDLWTSPQAAKLGRIFDRTIEIATAAGLIIIGSVNF
jgi:hypothetical protein